MQLSCCARAYGAPRECTSFSGFGLFRKRTQHPTNAPFTRMLLPSVSPAPRTPPSSRPKTHHTSTLVAVIDDFLILESVCPCVCKARWYGCVEEGVMSVRIDGGHDTPSSDACPGW